MRLKFANDDDSVTIYTQKWSNNSTAVIDIVLLSCMLLGLITFVATMTRLRMRRFNQQKDVYEKLRILQSNNPELHQEIMMKQRTMAEGIKVIEATAKGQQTNELFAYLA